MIKKLPITLPELRQRVLDDFGTAEAMGNDGPLAYKALAAKLNEIIDSFENWKIEVARVSTRSGGTTGASDDIRKLIERTVDDINTRTNDVIKEMNRRFDSAHAVMLTEPRVREIIALEVSGHIGEKMALVDPNALIDEKRVRAIIVHELQALGDIVIDKLDDKVIGTIVERVVAKLPKGKKR